MHYINENYSWEKMVSYFFNKKINLKKIICPDAWMRSLGWKKKKSYNSPKIRFIFFLVNVT